MDWNNGEQITIEELKAAIAELDRLDKEADEAKLIHSQKHALKEDQREKVLAMLQATGQSKFFAEGLGTVSQAVKYSVTVPKDIDSKKQMLEWFKDQGDDFFLTYVSVNSQSLNSLINEKCSSDPNFQLPGVGERQQRAELRFRRGK